jgi:hypothetical protein
MQRLLSQFSLLWRMNFSLLVMSLFFTPHNNNRIAMISIVVWESCNVILGRAMTFLQYLGVQAREGLVTFQAEITVMQQPLIP